MVMIALSHSHGILLFDLDQSLLVIRRGTRGMCFPVCLETRNTGVTLTTRVTDVGFFAMVDMSVKFHVYPLSVVPAACWAAVRFLPSVQPVKFMCVKKNTTVQGM